MKDKVSGAIAIPKASWGCAPALPNRMQMVSQRQAAGKQKFFDPTIFQKCWRGSGRVALIAARRQRNPCAMLLAHGGGGEKSDRICLRLASCNRYQIMPPIDSQSTEGICFGAFSVELTAFHPRKPHASKSAAVWFLHYLVQALVLALVLAQSAASFS